jgi:hypothetical protein
MIELRKPLLENSYYAEVNTCHNHHDHVHANNWEHVQTHIEDPTDWAVYDQGHCDAGWDFWDFLF